MRLDFAIRNRRAVRAFTGRVPSTEVIKRLLDAAIHAPSAVNKQPWIFTVIRDRATLNHISRGAKALVGELIETGYAPTGFRDIAMCDDYDVLYGAPALIVISALAADTWATEDAALAAQNLMLMAFAEGLGTCWVGFAQRWLETPEGKRAIGLPEYYRPVAPIILGHPKDDVPAVLRNPPVVDWID